MMMMVIITVPCCRQDVVRSWYSRLPALVQNAHQLVSNSEDCAKAVLEGETLHRGPVSVQEVFRINISEYPTVGVAKCDIQVQAGCQI